MKDATIIKDFYKVNKRIDELALAVSHNILNNQDVVLNALAIQDILLEKNIITKEEFLEALKKQSEKFNSENKDSE